MIGTPSTVDWFPHDRPALGRAKEKARAIPRRADRGRERLDVVGTLMAAAVDEERRRARDAARVGRGDILGHPRRVHPPANLLDRPLGIEADLLAVAAEVL